MNPHGDMSDLTLVLGIAYAIAIVGPLSLGVWTWAMHTRWR